jgi:hypothetical protein
MSIIFKTNINSGLNNNLLKPVNSFNNFDIFNILTTPILEVNNISELDDKYKVFLNNLITAGSEKQVKEIKSFTKFVLENKEKINYEILVFIVAVLI